jgi:hypothetical protein
MRFKGKEITISWFAFIPVKIQGETRWLENVKVKGYWWLGASGTWYWENLEFID